MLPDNWFESIKQAYPKRQGSQGWYGKPFAQILERRLSEGFTFDDMLKGAKAYKAHADHTQITGTTFVMQAKRFFGPSCYFMELDSYEIPTTSYTHRKPEKLSAEQKTADILAFERDMKRLGVK